MSESKDKKEWEKASSEGMTNMDFETWQWSQYIMTKEEATGCFNCSCGGLTEDFVCNKCGTFFESLFLRYRGDKID